MNYSRFFAVALLALASNLDNVGVGIAYGIRKTRVPFTSNLLIAAITASGTLASMLFGHTLSRLFSQSLAGSLGGLVLIAMGLWVVAREALLLYKQEPAMERLPALSTASSYLGKVHTIQQNPLCADGDLSGQIDSREAILLGLALTPNNLVNGTAAGMMGLSVAGTVILVVLLSVLTIWAGIAAGRQCGKRWLGNLAGVISGALLVFVGTCEIVV